MLKNQSSISYGNGIWSEVVDKYSESEGGEGERWGPWWQLIIRRTDIAHALSHHAMSYTMYMKALTRCSAHAGTIPLVCQSLRLQVGINLFS